MTGRQGAGRASLGRSGVKSVETKYMDERESVVRGLAGLVDRQQQGEDAEADGQA